MKSINYKICLLFGAAVCALHAGPIVFPATVQSGADWDLFDNIGHVSCNSGTMHPCQSSGNYANAWFDSNGAHMSLVATGDGNVDGSVIFGDLITNNLSTPIQLQFS